NLTSEVLFAIGGSVAVAVGFGLKDLLASLMAGLLILFDRPFQVGDRVQIGDTYGEVVEIGLRTTRIVTLDDNLVSIPNSRFLTDSVASANAGALDQMCVFTFYVRPDQDYLRAKRIVYESAVTSRFVYLRKRVSVQLKEAPVPGLDGMGPAIHLTCKAYVMDGRFESAFGTDVHERAKAGFRAAGILTLGDGAPAPSDG
ncbi:MAG: mechanosensitive ion channel, partial [Deltaproteobacteria bacterium]|nr:mechanosensitive ion channel [Deltaproteobacteria bacterium]